MQLICPSCYLSRILLAQLLGKSFDLLKLGVKQFHSSLIIIGKISQTQIGIFAMRLCEIGYAAQFLPILFNIFLLLIHQLNEITRIKVMKFRVFTIMITNRLE